jgi:hypothetical protein
MHAFLSPSSYHWIDDDEDKLRARYFAKQQTERGNKIHSFAQQAIELGIKLPDDGTTLSTYINDAIGFRMSPEVPLIYSEDCFGTADALGIRMEKRNWILRISDLKTGVSATSMKQPLIYAGLFFFEYEELFDPNIVDVILRIYQNDAIEEYCPSAADLLLIMDRIKTQADLIARLREEDM